MKKLFLSSMLLCLAASQVYAISVAQYVAQNGVPRIGNNLDFSNTGLTSLNGLSAILQASPRVRAINLSNNNVTQIPADTFNNAPQLRDINLSHNPIAQLPQTVFSNLPNLTSLDLTGNPLPYTTSDFLNIYIRPYNNNLANNKFTFSLRAPAQALALQQLLLQRMQAGATTVPGVFTLLEEILQLVQQNPGLVIPVATDAAGNTILHKLVLVQLNNANLMILLMRTLAHIWPNFTVLFTPNNQGQTPFHRAAALADHNLSRTIVGELVALLPNVATRSQQLNVQDNNGNIPVKVALFNHNLQLIQLLQGLS